MNALPKPKPQPHVSVDDYLAAELSSDIKHEYLGGQVVAMGGASDRHGLLTTSLSALLLPHARRKACQVFTNDMKVRLNHDGDSYFYYPDLLLSCAPDDRESAYYRRQPCMLVEVLSPSTERIDSREKLFAYRLLPSLRAYLLLRQDSLHATLYQLGDTGHWQHLVFSQADDVLPIDCLDTTLRLGDVYQDLPDVLAPT